MNKFIAISPWILFIVFHSGSYGFENGSYVLNGAAIVHYRNQELSTKILRSEEPHLHVNSGHYLLTYKARNDNYRMKNVNFGLTKILMMVMTIVYIETGDGNTRILLDFDKLKMAQNLSKSYSPSVHLETRREFNLLSVLSTNITDNPEIISGGKLWIDPHPTNDFCRLTIIRYDNNSPYFIFDSKDFNVSGIKNQYYVFLTINVNGDNGNYVLKFATPKEAETFHELVTGEEHVETSITIPRNVIQSFNLP